MPTHNILQAQTQPSTKKLISPVNSEPSSPENVSASNPEKAFQRDAAPAQCEEVSAVPHWFHKHRASYSPIKQILQNHISPRSSEQH